MTNEDVVKVRAYMSELRAAGLNEDEITRRLVKDGLTDDSLKEVGVTDFERASAEVKAPIEVGITKEPQDPLELIMDAQHILAKAMPVLWDHHRPFQYEALCELKNLLFRFQERLNGR